ncbi:hypothetical protein SBA1_720024 [Candidatus Sulfotelmatobacter kueseliae]|uniref:Uncharacterized protein n=1 Tax=Candidatus Sulfotelmatobacter kueseliae TaxID=2042962 RepID=A0A2U3L5P0_9BACT|nr:hypothetical protein SBA1_720024 [Candidatus Sulfotelmatobacter kueseliae]
MRWRYYVNNPLNQSPPPFHDRNYLHIDRIRIIRHNPSHVLGTSIFSPRPNLISVLPYRLFTESTSAPSGIRPRLESGPVWNQCPIFQRRNSHEIPRRWRGRCIPVAAAFTDPTNPSSNLFA